MHKDPRRGVVVKDEFDLPPAELLALFQEEGRDLADDQANRKRFLAKLPNAFAFICSGWHMAEDGAAPKSIQQVLRVEVSCSYRKQCEAILAQVKLSDGTPAVVKVSYVHIASTQEEPPDDEWTVTVLNEPEAREAIQQNESSKPNQRRAQTGAPANAARHPRPSGGAARRSTG